MKHRWRIVGIGILTGLLLLGALKVYQRYLWNRQGSYLVWAAYGGEIERVLDILKEHPELLNYQQKMELGCTPLLAACNGGSLWGKKSAEERDKYVKLIYLLVEAGADVNAHATIHNETPLMYICMWGDDGVPAAKYLLERGADPCATNEYGGSILGYVPEDAPRMRKLIEEAVRERCKGKQRASNKDGIATGVAKERSKE